MKWLSRTFGACAVLGLLLIAVAPVRATEATDRFLFEEMLKLAGTGDPEAQYHVGMMYNNGIGTAADHQQALQWFQKSTEGGDPLGAFKLGCYYDGQFPGVVEVDHQLGLKYKLVAAEQGYDLAQSGVARHYRASKDFNEAVRWWTMAANQGETDSMHYLSEAYALGEIVETDLPKSYRYAEALRQMPEFSSDQWVAAALASLAQRMTADQVAAAKAAPAFVIEPTALTLKARDGLTQAKLHLAENLGKTE